MTRKFAAGVWDKQFDSTLDYPTTPVRIQYVLCTSPRSGSHYVGHLLHQTGGFGYPLEYVQSANFSVWSERARQAGFGNTLAYVKSVRTDTNGVFGVKAHYRHLQRLLEQEPDILSYRFITLERRHLVSQAVSYAWAAQTKSWISTMAPAAEARYNWELIAEKLQTIAEGNAGWRAFVAELGIEALPLVFEDVRLDPEGTVARIAAFIGVEPRNQGSASTFFPSEQADPEKRAWATRFIEESRIRLQRGELLRSRDSHLREPGLRRLLMRLMKPRSQ